MSKYSISSYVADGSTTDFLITWDYLDPSHITVYVDAVNVNDAGSGYQFALINSTTVRVTTELGATPPNGAIIEVRRETPINTQAVTFFDGSSLNGEDLNKNTNYLLYAMQEAIDTVDVAAQNGAQQAQITTEGYRDEAEVSKNAAAASAAAAASSESNASTSETNAAASAAAALASQNAAASSESSASSSASSASTSLSNAIAAELSAIQASSDADTAKTAAELAALNATSAANSAESAWDFFDDRYLGSKSSAPSLDNDGDPLVAGAIYWNSTGSVLQVYNGSSWENVATLSSNPSFNTVTATTFNGDDFFVDTNTGLALGAPGEADMVVGGSVIARYTTSGASFTGNITVSGTVDGRDVAADGTKLDTIESGADVTDATNVAAAGALMESTLTSAASVKGINQALNTTASPSFTNLTATSTINLVTADFGAWTVTETSNVLYFKYNGVNKMKLDSSGNLTVVGNVTAYGSV